MKASEFLKARGKPAPSQPVTIHLVADTGTEQSEALGAPAVFRFVSDRIKADADGDAAAALARLKSPATDEIRAAYEQSYFLHAALRDATAPAEPFFDGADECRAMLVPTERLRLLAVYQQWIELQFPDDFDSVKLKEAMADAESFTVSALLLKYGYVTTRRCVILSEVTRTRSQTQ